MYYIGVDLGGTNIAVGIVNEEGKILRKDSVPTRANREPDEIVKDMASLCLKICNDEGISINDVEYIGVAAPGTADSDTGYIVYTNNIPFVNYPLADKMKEFTGAKRVLIENDANAAAKGEAEMGAAKGYMKSVMITLGTGVGSGIIIDKKVYSGFNYAGGEIGHTVVEVDGLPCTCGRCGCWEAYSSATGLINMTKAKMKETKDTLLWELAPTLDDVSGKTAFMAMKQGDKAGKEVVDKFIKYLAAGIVNTINIFQPEVVVIGGGVCKEGEYITKPLQEYIDREEYGRHGKNRAIVKIAALGNDAGIVGAAMLGF